MIMIIIITINYYEKYRYLNVANTWRKKHDYERLVYKWELFDRLFVCVTWMRVCFFERHFGRMLERVNERERESERKKKGPCIGGGVEWMRQLYSPLNSYKISTPKVLHYPTTGRPQS